MFDFQVLLETTWDGQTQKYLYKYDYDFWYKISKTHCCQVSGKEILSAQ